MTAIKIRYSDLMGEALPDFGEWDSRKAVAYELSLDTVTWLAELFDSEGSNR